ncbi:hypothetical protein JB92DRAFT_3134512 [Gautieria morchelliformis]|nr:hypothetical protein JB92DRAFT_3134512 [Gautieria morchelliformis]
MNSVMTDTPALRKHLASRKVLSQPMWELGLDTLDPLGVTPGDSIAGSSTQPIASQLISGSASDEHARDDLTVEDLAIWSADCSRWDNAGYWLRIEEMIIFVGLLNSFSTAHGLRTWFCISPGMSSSFVQGLSGTTKPPFCHPLIEQHEQNPFMNLMFMDLQENHWTLFHHSLCSNALKACTRYNPTSGWLIHNYLQPPGTSPIPLETSYISFPTQLQEDSSTCGFWVVVMALTLLLHLDPRDVYALQPPDIKTLLATLYATYVCSPEGLTTDTVVQALAQHQLSSMELCSMHSNSPSQATLKTSGLMPLLDMTRNSMDEAASFALTG